MSIRGHRWMAGLLLLGAMTAVHAQKVYRCGPDGRTYQQAPCAEGRPVDAADPRSTEQRHAAQDVARSEAKAAAKYDRDQLPASAPKSGKAAPAAPAASAARKPADADKPLVFVAPVKPKAAASSP